MKDRHPTLWKVYLTYALGSILAGLNFIYLTPAFMPFDMPKWPVGLIFLSCGVIELLLLLFVSSATWLRRSMALTVFIYLFWVGALTYDFFARSQTSMQLPIFVLIGATVALFSLIEPFINPATAKNGNGNGNGKGVKKGSANGGGK